MEHTQRGASGPAPGPRFAVRALAGTLLAVGLRKAEAAQLDADKPGVVRSTPLATELQVAALRMAAEGRDDESAVQELAARAGRHTKDLRRAAAAVRAGGWVHEDLRLFKANALLLAAAGGGAVARLDAAEEARLRKIDEVLTGTLTGVFGELVRREPALADVERLVRERSADYSEIHTATVAGGSARMELRRLIADSLSSLIGPDAATVDPLLRTNRAKDVAERYLQPTLQLNRTTRDDRS